MRYFIDTDIAEKYNLDDRKMNVYFGLCRLTYKQPWKRNNCEFTRLFRFKSVSTVRRDIDDLIALGLIDVLEDGLLIVHHEQTTVHHEQQIVHHEQKSKEERTKEENINKEKSGVVIDHTTHTTFFDFFNIFSPHGEYKTYEKACKKIWDTMPEDWRALAKARGASVSTTKNPLFYLQDEDFLKVGTADPSQKEKAAPTWLTGEQQTDCLRAGIILAVCKNPETGKFGTVTKEDADKFGLNILRTM